MARKRSRKGEPGKEGEDENSSWARLTWADLERWAGSRSVARGRAYQRGGRVKDLTISTEGELLATVRGGERYATTVALRTEGKSRSLESACTCPVAISCKHAVAVVADYLQALADGRDVPPTAEDDPRLDDLDAAPGESQDDWDDGDDEDADDDEEYSLRKPRRRQRPTRQTADAVNWDAKIEQEIRSKTQGELADLAWSLVRRFPEVYQEFRERIALRQGDVAQLLAEARREIRRVTSEPAWQNHWNGEGSLPDYSRIRHRLERLLDQDHADEVVSLGRDLIDKGMQQVGESHDEGETAMALGECIAIVFRALARSSLSGPDRLLYAIDASLSDDYDVIDEGSAQIFEAPYPPEVWSAVADTLIGRLRAAPDRDKPRGVDFSRDYIRDAITDWIASALADAGRDEELRTLYETEARATASYERIVRFLLEKKEFDDAERWAKEGIAATGEKLPGIAAKLVLSLGELAQKRKRWDVVAAHSASKFFSDYPGLSTFDDLMKDARKAGVEEPVRAAALWFLETGAMPYQVISPRVPAAASGRTKSPTKKRAASPPPAEPKPDRVKIDPSWPLPVPAYLVPLMSRKTSYDVGPRPHLDVLLEMAIVAKRPDEILRWYDKMRAGSSRVGHWFGHADRVAEAVAKAYPERTIEIYLAALNAQLPQAQQSSYVSAASYLRKLRPFFKAMDRSEEWEALLASIREQYRGRPRFMELLDGLDSRSIVQAARTRKK